MRAVGRDGPSREVPGGEGRRVMADMVDPRYGAPFISKAERKNPDFVLRKFMRWMPDAAEKDTWPLFRVEVLGDPELIEACLRWYHVNARNRLINRAPKTQNPVDTDVEKEA